MLNSTVLGSRQSQQMEIVATRIAPISSWLSRVVFIYLLALVFVPLNAVVPLAHDALLYWISATAVFWSGLRFGETSRLFAPRESSRPRLNDSIAATKIVVCVSIFGVGLLLFDRHIVRGAPISFEFLAVREGLENKTEGLIGMFSAALSAFAPFAWLSCNLLRASGHTLGKPWFLASILVVTAYVVISLMAGSRTVLVMVLLLQLFASHYVRTAFYGKTLSTTYILWLILISLVCAAALALIMYLRLDDMGVDPLYSIRSSAYSDLLQPSPWLLALLESTGVSLAAMLASVVSLLMYIYHGLFEFSLLFDSFTGQHTHGGATFWLPLKVLDKIFGIDSAVDIYMLPGVRFGIYTTFLGPIFIDFGLAAFPVLACIGALFGASYRMMLEKRIEWVPFSLVLYPIVILFPVLSMIDSAAGAYLLAAAPLVSLLNRIRFSR